MQKEDNLISVIGLGYVGLPLAAELGKKRKVIGFDINHKRIEELHNYIDITGELSKFELKKSKYLIFTNKPADISNSTRYIITVPTPIDKKNNPDLSFIYEASKLVAKYLKKGDIVIYESTVYPGLTEEECVPILEKYSKLVFNKDFYCGYSPERINPGDKKHKITSIKKITSGSTPEVSRIVDKIYSEIITAGTFRATSIKVAEAAKVIENTQRDLNIALINELSIIFNKMDIETSDVLEAAASKWNFIPFSPGLVGGHCIGVDPYYLTSKAESLGYKPKIILSGRKLNDGMPKYVSNRMLSAMLEKDISIKSSKILILGLSFKENCTDLRNTKVVDVIKQLSKQVRQVDVFDPYIDPVEALKIYKVDLISTIKDNYYDGILLAVPHKYFTNMGPEKIKKHAKKNSIFFDLKSVFGIDNSDIRL